MSESTRNKCVMPCRRVGSSACCQKRVLKAAIVESETHECRPPGVPAEWRSAANVVDGTSSNKLSATRTHECAVQSSEIEFRKSAKRRDERATATATSTHRFWLWLNIDDSRPRRRQRAPPKCLPKYWFGFIIAEGFGSVVEDEPASAVEGDEGAAILSLPTRDGAISNERWPQ